MASVPLRFVPPYQEELVALHILESPAQDGPYAEIEVVTDIGSFPEYIDNYTTNLAGAVDHWFAIQWEDAKGALTEISQPIQGGTTTYLARLVDRVMLRNPNASEAVVIQEAEVVIEEILHVDPYAPVGTVSYRTWSGMTFLVLARVGVSELISGGQTESFTAGLVSMKSATTGSTSEAVIDRYLKEANRLLGISQSRIALMEELVVAGGYRRIVARDISRSIIEIA
jgi:hypothetical protein